MCDPRESGEYDKTDRCYLKICCHVSDYAFRSSSFSKMASNISSRDGLYYKTTYHGNVKNFGNVSRNIFPKAKFVYMQNISKIMRLFLRLSYLKFH